MTQEQMFYDLLEHGAEVPGETGLHVALRYWDLVTDPTYLDVQLHRNTLENYVCKNCGSTNGIRNVSKGKVSVRCGDCKDRYMKEYEKNRRRKKQ